MNLENYCDLFKGRIDTYAKHWEKNERKGFSPAYKFDWNQFLAFKAQGGTMKDFPDKEQLPLSPEVIQKHLNGIWRIGMYPLLDDNTSYFIAADFDKDNWQDETKAFWKICTENNIPAYIERSNSGNGTHVWIFFESKYPAYKSRKVILEFIRQSQNISQFQKEVSFDRLFPSQDFHHAKGFGNLIALPLHGKALESQNTAFLDPHSFAPYEDQWTFLENIQKVPVEKMDELFAYFSDDTDNLFSTLSSSKKNTPRSEKKKSLSSTVKIHIQNQLIIAKENLNGALIRFIRDELNFLNSEYLSKKKFGRSVYQTEKYLNCITETDLLIKIPRGFLNDLENFCKAKNIDYELVDEREKKKSVSFTSCIALRPYQEEALLDIESFENGVLVAPPGAGKTVMGLEMINQKKQPALILVHRKQLLDQWLERIESFLKIPKKEIGQISGAKKKVGKSITVAMMQTLSRMSHEDVAELEKTFGLILVDECHHIPAKTFRDVITQLDAFYLYGLTATPTRKHNDEKLIFMYIGDVITEVTPTTKDGNEILDPHIHIRETVFQVPFNVKTDQRELFLKMLIYDSRRNEQIVEDIQRQLEHEQKILVLTERKEHVDILNLYLRDKCEVITITGSDGIAEKKSKLKQIQDGHFQVLISTGQFFGEGMDIEHLDCLFLVFPFSFEGKLKQYIGRIQRNEGAKKLFDYRDKNIPYLDRMFKQRNRYYNKLDKQNPSLGI